MTPPDIVVYAGSVSTAGFDDTTPGRVIAAAIERADGVLIVDPLSFPWEMFTQPPSCPVAVDVSTCTADDCVALRPALTTLLASDVMFGDRAVVDELSEALGFPSLWASADLDLTQHVAAVAVAKRCDLEEHLITTDLGRDPDLEIVRVAGETIRSERAGFAALVEQLRDGDDRLHDAPLVSIEGVRGGPGQPLDRAILAFRPARLREPAP